MLTNYDSELIEKFRDIRNHLGSWCKAIQTLKNIQVLNLGGQWWHYIMTRRGQIAVWARPKKWYGKNPDQNENKTRTEILGRICQTKKSCLDFCQAKFLWSGPDRYLPTSDQESRFRTSLFEKSCNEIMGESNFYMIFIREICTWFRSDIAYP